MKKKTILLGGLISVSLWSGGTVLAQEAAPASGTVSPKEQQVVTKQAQKEGIDQSTVQAENQKALEKTQTTIERVERSAHKATRTSENLSGGENEYGSYYLPSGLEHSDLKKEKETSEDDTSMFDLEMLELPTVSAADANLPSKSFVDVSSNNGAISVAAYRTMKAYGVRGVVVKLTESTNYRNPYAQGQIQNAKAAGLKVSAYHYSWFTSDAQARNEANAFAAYANQLGLPKSTVMVNDIEAPGIISYGNHTTDSAAFADQLHRLGFGSVRHYVGYGWLSQGLINGEALGNKNLWVAAYPYTLTANNYYMGYGAWQWSPQVTFPGVGGVFDVSADYTGIYEAAAPKEDAPAKSPAGTAAMYRMYNPNSGEHFYTKDNNEKNTLIRAGWRYESVAWDAPNSGQSVYRMYNPNAGDHHYTMNANERDQLKKAGWRYEGVSWYSGGSRALYRLYNPNAKAGSHHYTMDTNERDHLRQVGWRYEGISWYGK